MNQSTETTDAVVGGHSPSRILANLPYAIMTIVGTLAIVVAYGTSPWRWLWAGLYLLYGMAGVLWIMLFLCPHCKQHGTDRCVSGYGAISARLTAARDGSRFREKFAKHIPVIVPLWFIPPIAGGVAVSRDFSWALFAILAVFVVDAFIVLPMVSKKHSCAKCPQRKFCPWMNRRKQASRPACP